MEHIKRTIAIFAPCPAPATPKIRTSQLAVLPILGLLPASTVADFVIGKYSGQQLGGTFQTPGQLGVTGTWISTNIPGQDSGFTTSDFCDAGTSADASVDEWKDWTNNDFCDLEVPGCPSTMRIVKSAGSFSGDCGAEVNNADYTGDYGVLIDTVTSPNAAIGNCYYAGGDLYENCASTGSVYYNALVVCLTGVCGGVLESEFNP
ncbi:hypothetical protein AA0117_g42 [Alternaria alternata]|uniref:Uncharacterized protein n=1 Tax=Alternaria alternata TaxID=5599 RepID=A0A4Q4NYM0_ALTAL|nr:hypothetical protein AA0117_g42 [Alternaria alternata]